MADIVDIAIPANAQAAAEALGLVVMSKCDRWGASAPDCARRSRDSDRMPARLWVRRPGGRGYHMKRIHSGERLTTGCLSSACHLHRDPMSKKKERGLVRLTAMGDWSSGTIRAMRAAARALRTDPKVLTRLRQRTPVRSTLLKLLRRFGGLHVIGVPADELIVDTRSR